MNPFLTKFDTPYNSIPFEEIKLEHYKPAFEEAMRQGKAEVDAIVQNPTEPTFENTILALESSGKLLGLVSATFFNLNSAETSDEMQQLAQEISPLLTQHGNDIMLNEALFQRVKKVYENPDANLDSEDKMLLEKTYKGFSRNGANLPEDQKQTLRKINEELAMLSLTFGENVLAETNLYELHIENEADLKGLPAFAMDAAQKLAKDRGKEGWIFTLQQPSYVPFVTYLENRALRKKMTLAFGSRAFHQNEHNNEEIVKRIAQLRFERANLLGYNTHADFVLEERMAKNPENVKQFLNRLLGKAKPYAMKEVEVLKQMAQKDGIDTLERWDHAFYAEKLKQEQFNFNDEILKPYFKLENVIEGVFKVSNLLFGLQFKEIFDVQKYHPEVKTYTITDEKGEFIALFYADFHPRAGKRGGAWMTSFRGQFNYNQTSQRPHIANVCNFTPSTDTQPSLLTFNEVTTLFHEFGHALHCILANTKYESLSGTSVYWDFVELPSQLLENWCYEKEALDLFAQHYETGEKIPQEYIEKIKHLKSFMEGYQTVRQVSFGLLDMEWHAQDPTGFKTLSEVENKAFAQTELYPKVAEVNMSAAFSHIFQGGYAAGYYSYKWAEVLDADAFAYFKETGIFNPKTATSLKENILSKGGTEPPMELYKRFRGQEPDEKYLLERAGLK